MSNVDVKITINEEGVDETVAALDAFLFWTENDRAYVVLRRLKTMLLAARREQILGDGIIRALKARLARRLPPEETIREKYYAVTVDE